MFVLLENTPETLFDYVIDKDGKLIVFHFSFEVKAAEISITAASSGQPWCYTSQGQEILKHGTQQEMTLHKAYLRSALYIQFTVNHNYKPQSNS